MVDGSGSIEDQDWIEEQKFAKDAVAAFARRNIFDNGGSASYVQFSSFPLDMGTFYSEEDFDAHVDSLDQYKGGTDIVNGKRPNASAKPFSPSPILRVGCDVPLRQIADPSHPTPVSSVGRIHAIPPVQR